MAIAVYSNDIPDYTIGVRSLVQELRVLHEPVIENIDNLDQNDSQFVGVFMRVQATGQSEDLNNSGRIRVVAEYTDNTVETIETGETPFAGVSIPEATSTWMVLDRREGSRCTAGPLPVPVPSYSRVETIPRVGVIPSLAPRPCRNCLLLDG